MQGWGIDMNPLSVYIAGVKVRLLNAQVARLASAYEDTRETLLTTHRAKNFKLRYFESLAEADKRYLVEWFSDDVLASLDEIMQAIERVNYNAAKELMRVSLSNIIRRVSWQKVDDLRVRREIRLDVEIDPKREFLEEVGRSVRATIAFLRQEGRTSATYDVKSGDARECGTSWGRASVDTVITSPPYATALPYLDTDRLSLCYLQLLPRSEHRRHDREMIGNREISEGLRADYWGRFELAKDSLPSEISDLITRINALNECSDVGFRRRNLAALLAKYFYDMKEVVAGVRYALKRGSYFYMVVGSNHTIAGGQRIDINTPELLKHIAHAEGFEVQDSIPMEMLASRDIFRRNSGATEEILVFRKTR
jgi:site-specific DNA-methyltransferase (cytosine-N4-specific)